MIKLPTIDLSCLVGGILLLPKGCWWMMASIKHAVAPPGQFRPHHSCRIETFNHSCSFAPDEANGTIQYNTTHYGQIRSVLTKPIHPVLHCPWSMTSSCHKEHTLLWNGSHCYPSAKSCPDLMIFAQSSLFEACFLDVAYLLDLGNTQNTGISLKLHRPSDS